MLISGIRNQWSLALGLLVGSALWAGLPARAEAHVGGRVFPVPELTEEMLEQIQLDDGSVEEWFDLLGEPAMTLLDFAFQRQEGSLDPSDIDFRIWLAWHDEPARLYVAFAAADDNYWNDHTYDVDNWSESSEDDMLSGWDGGNDGIALGVDGDHSGGPALEGVFTTERLVKASGETQQYEAVSRTPVGPILDNRRSRHWSKVFSWMTLPPYAEAGGSVAGERPVIWTIELYVTPFDHREGLTSPEGSVASDLSAGQTIGFAIGVYDADLGNIEYVKTFAPEAHVDLDREVFEDISRFASDYFLDGLLLPANPAGPGENGAVESVSWGRIKASLEME